MPENEIMPRLGSSCDCLNFGKMYFWVEQIGFLLQVLSV